MATAHVTRARGVRSARTRSTPKSRPVTRTASKSPASRRLALRRSPKPQPTRRRKPRRPDELNTALAGMALRLEVLYSTCVTVELALKEQNADQDADISRCLMWHVTEPLSVQAQALQAIVGRLARRSAGPAVRS